MARLLPKSLKGFSAFADGYGLAGILKSGKLPVVKIKTEAFRDGGMDSEEDLDMGTEKMGYEIVLSEMNRIALALVGRRDAGVTLRGSIEDEAGVKVPVIAQMRGLVTEADAGEWKVGEGGETKLVGTPNYYRLTIGGVEVYEIDVRNGVRRIDGVDQLAGRRQNLGV